MKIAVIGDLHYPELPDANELTKLNRQAFYETFINRFFSVPANLYVSIGDLTNLGTPKELEEIYALIKQHDKRFMHVLGNHDLYTLTRQEVLAVTRQERSYVISTEHAVLAFIDTPREQDFSDCGGMLTQKQLSWLQDVINESGERPLILFAHHPPYSTTTRSEQDMRSIHPEVPIWDVLSTKKGIGLYVNGHNHCNCITEKGQWTFVQLAAVLDQQAVRTIDITDSELVIDFTDLSDIAMQQQAQVVGNVMNHFQLRADHAGTEADIRRKVFIPYAKPVETL